MISESSPSTSSTAVRRRCSSSKVPDSLKSGTTIERSSPRARVWLRGMAKVPFGHIGEVMTNQLDPLVLDEVVRIGGAEQLHLFGTGGHQSRASLRERRVDVPGMDHELGDAGPKTTKQPFE